MKNNRLLYDIFTRITLFLATAVITLGIANTNDVKAKALDEILSYEITADVLDDATVDLTYDIKWKVLDSKSEGPLEWVQIGIPNSHYSGIVGLSDNIKSISTKNSGGTYAVIYFDRKYYQDEVAEFSFKVNQDYMYQVFPEENLVEYNFTPGWFDGIQVDSMKLKWNSDKTIKIEPSSFNENGYYCWEASLDPGQKFSIEVQYPTDAYAFDLSQHDNASNDDDGYKYSEHSLIENILFTLLIIFVVIIMIGVSALPIAIPILIVFFVYKSASGFSVKQDKKITRTIVEYYDSCPNCGGTREEGKEKCSYCGSNMVKSKEEVTEESKVSDADKKILDFTSKGEYRYSDNPNRYVRVNVISVPHIVHSTAPRSSSTHRSSGSHHSSCAHSSCACACACACAGGGRAGCSTKDFYNTNMKLKYLK